MEGGRRGVDIQQREEEERRCQKGGPGGGGGPPNNGPQQLSKRQQQHTIYKQEEHSRQMPLHSAPKHPNGPGGPGGGGPQGGGISLSLSQSLSFPVSSFSVNPAGLFPCLIYNIHSH